MVRQPEVRGGVRGVTLPRRSLTSQLLRTSAPPLFCQTSPQLPEFSAFGSAPRQLLGPVFSFWCFDFLTNYKIKTRFSVSNVTSPLNLCARLCDERWRPPPSEAGAGSSGSSGSSGDGDHKDFSSSRRQQQQEGRLGDACCRLLAALVLTTAMHPGTLVADLGAGPFGDGPVVRRDRERERDRPTGRTGST